MIGWERCKGRDRQRNSGHVAFVGFGFTDYKNDDNREADATHRKQYRIFAREQAQVLATRQPVGHLHQVPRTSRLR